MKAASVQHFFANGNGAIPASGPNSMANGLDAATVGGVDDAPNVSFEEQELKRRAFATRRFSDVSFDFHHCRQLRSQYSWFSLSFSKRDMTEEEQTFRQAFLDAHNRLRIQHGAEELSLSPELCERAQYWAEKLASKRYMSYCELPGIGENITCFPTNISPEEIVDYWYNEHRFYEYDTPGWQAGTNYFTQMVWKSTKEIGIGCAKVPSQSNTSSKTINQEDSCSVKSDSAKSNSDEWDNQMVVVAFYRPAGNNNRAGQFAINVRKPKQREEQDPT